MSLYLHQNVYRRIKHREHTTNNCIQNIYTCVENLLKIVFASFRTGNIAPMHQSYIREDRIQLYTRKNFSDYIRSTGLVLPAIKYIYFWIISPSLSEPPAFMIPETSSHYSKNIIVRNFFPV